jgi:hypothetical protein
MAPKPLKAAGKALHTAEHVVGGEARHAAELLRTEPFWQAQAALIGALILYITLPTKLILGPTWLMPALELLLVVGLWIDRPRTGRATARRDRTVVLVLLAMVAVAGDMLVVGGDGERQDARQVGLPRNDDARVARNRADEHELLLAAPTADAHRERVSIARRLLDRDVAAAGELADRNRAVTGAPQLGQGAQRVRALRTGARALRAVAPDLLGPRETASAPETTRRLRVLVRSRHARASAADAASRRRCRRLASVA